MPILFTKQIDSLRVKLMAKVVNIRNSEALRLVNARAVAEGRSAENAANRTIIESLSPIYGRHGTQNSRNSQAKNRPSFREDMVEK